MQEITKKLHKQALNLFYPVIEQMAEEGASEEQIVDAFQKHLNIKTRQYHQRDDGPKTISALMNGILDKVKADSHTEQIFYDLLINRKIRFQFQYKIGPYKADYLLAGFIVVEIDGPQHSKSHDDARDKYMRRMGYKIIRVPTWVLVMDPDAVIEEIESLMKIRRIK